MNNYQHKRNKIKEKNVCNKATKIKNARLSIKKKLIKYPIEFPSPAGHSTLRSNYNQCFPFCNSFRFWKFAFFEEARLNLEQEYALQFQTHKRTKRDAHIHTYIAHTHAHARLRTRNLDRFISFISLNGPHLFYLSFSCFLLISFKLNLSPLFIFFHLLIRPFILTP